LEKIKQNKGCWAELRAVKTSKLQYSSPDRNSEAKLKVEQGSYPMFNNKIRKGGWGGRGREKYTEKMECYVVK